MNTVRFKISKAVAQAMHLERIKRHARTAMVTDVRLAHDEKNVGANEIRITCSMAMAIFFVEELRRLTDKAKAQRNHVLVFECARASAAAIQGIDKADRAPSVGHVASASVEQRA